MLLDRRVRWLSDSADDAEPPDDDMRATASDSLSPDAARGYPVRKQSSYRRLSRAFRGRSQSWLMRATEIEKGGQDGNMSGVGSAVMIFFSWLVVLVTMPFSLICCLKVVREYERVVVFRLGRLARRNPRGPGLFFLVPFIDTFKKVDLRVLSFDVPPQEILSRDSVTVSVDAVVYFRVSDPVTSVTKVNDPYFSTKLLAQTTLRNVLGTKTLSEMLSERDSIASLCEKVLDEGTDPWGVIVERVEVKDIRLPHSLMRAMAAEAEATREARAKVIAAEGEHRASRALMEAAGILQTSSNAVHLRYLQTMSSIGAQNNQTIVLPVPVGVLESVGRLLT